MKKGSESVGNENKKIFDDFIAYCKQSDKSPKTISQYQEWLGIFFAWNYRENSDTLFVDVTKRDFMRYFGWLSDCGLSPARISTLRSALSSLSSEIELIDDDIYPEFSNKVRLLHPVKSAPVREKTIISTEQAASMLSKLMAAGETQLACYVALLLSSGCRKSEAVQMKDSFFCDSAISLNGAAWKTPEIRAKGPGKEGKRISKYVMIKSFCPYLEKWRAERSAMNIRCDDLFVIKKDGSYVPATETSADYFAKKISDICGIEFYAHCLRHYFCTYLSGKGVSQDAIAAMFSWSDPGMTKIYDDTPDDAKIQRSLNGIKFNE
jgi:integrase